MTENYESLKKEFQSQNQELETKYKQIGFARLILTLFFLFSLYKWINSETLLWLVLSVLGFALFVFSVIEHRKVSWKKKIQDALVTINQEEIEYLCQNKKSFDDGKEFINPNHFYSYDLDLFGEESLFHHLNRTQTFIGKQKLAENFIKEFDNLSILKNQKAVNELSSKLKYRQEVAAIGKIISDTEADYKSLEKWLKVENKPLSSTRIYLAYLLAFVFVVVAFSGVLGFISPKFIILSFVINLGYTSLFVSQIKEQVIESNSITRVIKHYGLILEKIESEKFEADLLKQLQNNLLVSKASQEIKNLSTHVLRVQGINFGLGAIFMNGTIHYHLHALSTLLKWKEKHVDFVQSWLEVMGEIEALSSLGNFYFNNQSFTFPDLNTQSEYIFEEMGHPLIPENKRVTNSVSLNSSNFMILTGSNMSGKSTFLRTLGINAVLAKMGSVVCAKKASVHPLPILVSMRQTDSLASGESYFFAEVKRLKNIIDFLQENESLVLLDEILRGTNSDDKQSGTVGVIEKVISHKAVGGIATHDLEVCNLTLKYPEKLENKNFEVEIINDELVFDYKLRNGVCKNKSATFLMKKMQIIE